MLAKLVDLNCINEFNALYDVVYRGNDSILSEALACRDHLAVRHAVSPEFDPGFLRVILSSSMYIYSTSFVAMLKHRDFLFCADLLSYHESCCHLIGYQGLIPHLFSRLREAQLLTEDDLSRIKNFPGHPGLSTSVFSDREHVCQEVLNPVAFNSFEDDEDGFYEDYYNGELSGS